MAMVHLHRYPLDYIGLDSDSSRKWERNVYQRPKILRPSQFMYMHHHASVNWGHHIIYILEMKHA